jgi:hypothetical protein
VIAAFRSCSLQVRPQKLEGFFGVQVSLVWVELVNFLRYFNHEVNLAGFCVEGKFGI